MRDGRPSATAQVAAVIRAVEYLEEPFPVFADPFALQLLSTPWRWVTRLTWLRRVLLDRLLLGALDGGAGAVLARARYAEENLAQAVARGVDQYVVIGAGLDSYALRQTGSAPVRVYEVDHPATQRHKRERLKVMGRAAETQVRFVEADLAVDALDARLAAAGFHAHRPAFFSWLGCVQYLDEAGVRSTLRALRRCAAEGSQLVLDFRRPETAHPSWARRLASLVGEPLRSEFAASVMVGLLREGGFSPVEMLDPAALARRYFAGERGGSVSPPTQVSVVRGVRA